MARRKVVKKKTSKFVKLIYTIAIILTISFPVVSIASKSFVSKLNQGLSMQINELASLENIQEIAKEYGLEYNNDNIKVVMNDE